ncbi:MAG TPA: ISAzo13 family transposase, partial [Desulfotomaculum sp.]|nr:ISAzo13 family transposase [Desulfotomaculum sp.]
LFPYITQTWRGRPLSSHEAIVSLIANTTTAAGLKVRRQLDNNEYPTGVRVSDAELNTVRLERSEFHGDWNYAIRPQEQL